MNEQELDRILNLMSDEEPHPEEAAAAQERVWHKLHAGPLCLRFREQFDAYRSGMLDEAKRMLLDDHLARCADCRRSLAGTEGRRPAAVVEMPSISRRGRKAWKVWAIAAGIAAVAIFTGRNLLDTMMAPSGPRATVRTVNGSLYALNAAELKFGSGLEEQQVVRTGAASRATLQLADGSVVEMNERTELHVSSAWSGQTIHLERGDIIVQAAKQRRGALRVVTRDSEAAVKGTIFTVSAGTAGSLVGVVEGSVAVKQPGTDTLLKPGEQSATNAALAKVTVKQAVSWSADAEKHFALLTELSEISKQITMPAARMQARMLPVLPPDIRVYGAIPNLGPTLTQAVSLIEQRSGESAVMQEWWGSVNAGELKQVINRVRTLSPLLGEEVVFVLSGKIPVVLAEVKNGQQMALNTEIAKLSQNEFAYRFVNNLFVATDSAAHLNTILSQLGQGAHSPFIHEVAARYARGVTWLFGVDVAATHPNDMNMRYLFLEQRTAQGLEENEATLSFQGERKGFASWLAAPGSAGSTEYVSPDALFVLSGATRSPQQIFDELAATFKIGDLRALEEKTGINLSTDLGASLGTDFTLSVETATVPVPGWFSAIEVYRADALNAVIRRRLEAYNREAPDNQRLTMSEETVNGRTWYTAGIPGIGLTWTYDRGYMVVGMDRGIVSRALQTRASGVSLVRSSQFRNQMPTLAGVHPSAFAWFHMEQASQVLAATVKSPALQKLAAIREPTLITVNGEKERIQIASRTRLSSLVLDAMMASGLDLQTDFK